MTATKQMQRPAPRSPLAARLLLLLALCCALLAVAAKALPSQPSTGKAASKGVWKYFDSARAGQDSSGQSASQPVSQWVGCLSPCERAASACVRVLAPAARRIHVPNVRVPLTDVLSYRVTTTPTHRAASMGVSGRACERFVRSKAVETDLAEVRRRSSKAANVLLCLTDLID